MRLLIAWLTGLLLMLASPAFPQTVRLDCADCLSYVPPLCEPIVASDVHIAEETAGFTIDIRYPVLCSRGATRTLRDHVTRTLADFKQDFPEHDLSEFRHKHEMIMEYAVWPTAGNRLTSVKLHTMVYTGGAHPNNWPETWVFDMAEGHAIDLDDIFRNRRDGLIAVAPMVREVLTRSLERMYLPDMLEPGTEPTAQNYRNFIVTDEGITFFFPPYQVAPYAAGQQVVTIPWPDIETLVRPSFMQLLR